VFQIVVHAECTGDEADLSFCDIKEHKSGHSRHHVGIQCFRIPSLSEFYYQWFTLGTALLGVMTAGVCVCAFWYLCCKNKGRKKGQKYATRVDANRPPQDVHPHEVLQGRNQSSINMEPVQENQREPNMAATGDEQTYSNLAQDGRVEQDDQPEYETLKGASGRD